MVDLLFSPSGRIGRMPFAITFIIAALLAVFALLYLEFGYAYRGTFIMLFSLSILAPALWCIWSVASKRLHDRGRPAWHLVMVFPLVEMFFVAGDSGENAYGPAVGGSVAASATVTPVQQGPRAQFGRRS